MPQYHCDPCPELDVTQADLMTLGGDIVGGQIAQGAFVLTRLHARYGKGDMKDDLRFKDAKPVTGGREQWSKQGLEYGASPSDQNYFQARYAMRHWWTGPIKCANPQRGVWGGPPNGIATGTIAANKLAFAPRGKMEVASVVKRDLWEIGLKRASSPNPPPAPNATKFATPPGTKAMGFGFGASAALALIALGLLIGRRKA